MNTAPRSFRFEQTPKNQDSGARRRITMSEAKRSVHETTGALRDAAGEFADRVDTVADEMAAASQRLGKHVRRVGDAFAEYGRDAERPATGVAKALDDLGDEAKKSFDRIVGRAPRPWYERFLFWK
jgi:hypothetical protein